MAKIVNQTEKFQSLDTEIAVLGIAIKDNASAIKLVEYLDEDSFYDKNNKVVFTAIKEIVNEDIKIDSLVLKEKLKKDNQLEKIGGLDFLGDLISSAGIKNSLQSYFDILSKNKLVRNFRNELEFSMKKLDESNDNLIYNTIEKIEEKIISISQDREYRDFKKIDQILLEYKQKIQDIRNNTKQIGVKSGYHALDYYINGFKPGDLIILAARPSMGKTALAINFLLNVAKSTNGDVAFFSLEMSSEQIIQRIISIESYLPSNSLNNPRKLDKMSLNKLDAVMDRIKNYKLHIDDTPGIKLGELIWKSKKLAQNGDLKLIVIDYLQLIIASKTSGDNRQQEVAEISRKLKQLAREIDVPIIAVAQLSRRVELRENKRPMMSDIRESGAIEQDADLISFLYRPDYYQREDESSDNRKTISICELIIAKHRQGATGNVKLNFDLETSHFYGMDIVNKKN